MFNESGVDFSPSGEVHVWYIDLTAVSSRLPIEYLSAEEYDRASKYRFEKDRRHFIIARYFLRSLLSRYQKQKSEDITFEAGPMGKPRLNGVKTTGLHFNMSHSGEIATVAVAYGKEVGMDTELVTRPIPGIGAVRRYLAKGELTLIDGLDGHAQAKAFYRIWTRKEALLKATGEGLGGLGSELDVSTGNDFRRMGKSWHVTDLDLLPDYVVALAVEGPACAVRLCQWHP